MVLVLEMDGLVQAPSVARDARRAARATLRAQIARLEAELAALAADAFPDPTPAATPAVAPRGAGAHLPDLGELERIRDALAARAFEARADAAARAERHAQARRLLADMYANPKAHKWVRLRGRDLGERTCAYHVRPRLGLVGMLMGWWEVKVSSGCPLAARRRGVPAGVSAAFRGRDA